MKIELTLPNGRIFTPLDIERALCHVAYVVRKDDKAVQQKMVTMIRDLQPIVGHVDIDDLGIVYYKIEMR